MNTKLRTVQHTLALSVASLTTNTNIKLILLTKPSSMESSHTKSSISEPPEGLHGNTCLKNFTCQHISNISSGQHQNSSNGAHFHTDACTITYTATSSTSKQLARHAPPPPTTSDISHLIRPGQLNLSE